MSLLFGSVELGLASCISHVEIKASATSLLNKWMALFGRSGGEML